MNRAGIYPHLEGGREFQFLIIIFNTAWTFEVLPWGESMHKYFRKKNEKQNHSEEYIIRRLGIFQLWTASPKPLMSLILSSPVLSPNSVL